MAMLLKYVSLVFAWFVIEAIFHLFFKSEYDQISSRVPAPRQRQSASTSPPRLTGMANLCAQKVLIKEGRALQFPLDNIRSNDCPGTKISCRVRQIFRNFIELEDC
jgi:hypothetical protein